MDTVRKTFRWSLPVLLILVSVIALVAWTPAEATVDHSAHTNLLPSTQLLAAVAPEPPTIEEEVATTEALSPENDLLVQYLYNSMRAWTSLPSEGSDPPNDEARAARNASSRARLGSTAADIVKMVRTEEPVFEQDENRSRTAVLVATVAFFESGFAEYVDKGQCNDWNWKHPKTTGPDAVSIDEAKRRAGLLAAGPCDGGLAYSDWQIHPFDGLWRDGIVLLDGPRAWAFTADVHDGQEHDVIHGRDMIGDRVKASRVALHMLRRALAASKGTGLCGYTGEGGGGCPKGAKRLNFAIDWSRKHPFSGM